MSKWKILCVCLCLAVKGLSQDVIYSTYEKFDFRNSDFAVVGKINSHVYTYRANPDGFFLDIFNDSMNKTATVILDFFPKKIYESRFIAYQDRIAVLYQSLDGTRITQFAALLDDKGRLIKRPVKIAEERTGFFGPSREYFSYAVSDDRKHILVYSAAAKYETLNFSGIWLDDQLNIVKRSSSDFKAGNNLTVGEGLLGSDGSFYITASTVVGGREYADQLWLLRMEPGGNRFTAAGFPLNNMFVASSYMKMDNVNSRIYMGGFYSAKKTGNYDGVLFGFYDITSGSFQNTRLIPLDERLRNATGERNLKKAFNDFRVRNLIVKNDGGFVLISESFFVTTRSSGYAPGWGYYSMYAYGPYMSPSVREYHYNDILSLSYNGEGANEWHAFVRKDQYSQEDGGVFSSYALINTGGTLGFLFNDYNTSRSRIQLASVDAQGNVTTRGMSAAADDPDWLPRSGKQVSARELIVPCIKKRQICFAKVVF